MEVFFSKHWKKILIISIPLLFICAVIVSIFKTPPDLGYTPNIADRVFNFLDEWASAGAPAIMLLAIIVSLIIGVKSLRQTENIQRNERNQRLLKEIEEWAKEVIDLVGEFERIAQESLLTLRFHTEPRRNILKQTKSNMKEIATEIDKDFGKQVEKAIKDFDYLEEDINVGGVIKSNITQRLQNCKDSCSKILESVGSLKFKDTV